MAPGGGFPILGTKYGGLPGHPSTNLMCSLYHSRENREVFRGTNTYAYALAK